VCNVFPMKIPALNSQLALGTAHVFVVEVEEPGSRSYGVYGFDTRDDRYIITAHDDYGNEVEIRFTPDEDED
jgi:hypothetical protein